MEIWISDASQRHRPSGIERGKEISVKYVNGWKSRFSF